MRCRICGKKDTRYAKIKNGILCESCYESMPRLIRENAYGLTSKQILNSCKVMKNMKTREDYWCYVGAWDEENPLLFGDYKMSVKDTEILYSDLESIELSFHPIKRYYGNKLEGWSVLKFTTKKPRISIEIELPMKRNSGEIMETEIRRYEIYGDQIEYKFYGTDRYIIRVVNQIIRGEETSLGNVRDRFYKILKEQEGDGNTTRSYCFTEKERLYREELKEEERRAKERKWQESARRKAEKDAGKDTGNTGYKNRSDSFADEKKTDSLFDKAKSLFGLEIPFSESDLKKRRNVLIKSAHPDAGGSEEEAVIINEYYDILKKFAVPSKG